VRAPRAFLKAKKPRLAGVFVCPARGLFLA